ncbi:fumarylacetoacetase [Primorskyibacter flagellatus]|uniref:fumarylacetoacetase n=1 Tax=Primorskyibacter flagellatus TaxID=1387277 RepID=A0A917A733_9RHOB|nr:fumarylacetoacetase [Primorskyibacter flagellatus]GGE32516.1 fumarylacetoacetase [Primorskyibacter flagellatus]
MPLLRSWVESANAPDTDFPLNNLPYGVFSTPDLDGRRMGVAIGDHILDLFALSETGVLRLTEDGPDPFREDSWNAFMALGPETWADLRAMLTEALSEDAPDRAQSALRPALVPGWSVDLHMPFRVSEYTDFYSGRHHAENVGRIFRPDGDPLSANWLSMPIGYNGRASSVVVSGTPVRRPLGQLPTRELPVFGASKRFDFELEFGAIVGQPSDGMISLKRAGEMIFGYVLLNDWSARDIQRWEAQPLGPFQAKATATTISPWIVTAAALAPFRCPPPERSRDLLPYLDAKGDSAYDIDLSVTLAPDGADETVICRSNTKYLYYNSAQQLTHHTTSGCPMRVGDLLGSGTISGPEKHQRAALLELSWGGKEPIPLDTGDTRAFLEDGDTVTLRGAARGDGYRIGFGDCAGQVLPAPDV